MARPTRPTTMPTWATDANFPAGANPWSGQPTKVAPSAGVQAAGYAPNAKPPAQHENWFKNLVASYLGWYFYPPSITDDAPQTLWTDAAGNNRFLVDHNGYPMGRLTVFEESWVAPSWDLTATTEPIPSTRFGVTNSGGANAHIRSVSSLSTVYASPIAEVYVSSGTAKGSYHTLAPVLHSGASFLSAVLEWDASIDNTTGTATEVYMGFTSVKDPQGVIAANSACARFRWTQGTANWQAETANGTSHTTNDAGIAPTVSSVSADQRFRIELHGSGSPYGACARFFINGVLRQTITATFPSAAMYITFGVYSPNTSVAQRVLVGPVRCVLNRTLAGATL